MPVGGADVPIVLPNIIAWPLDADESATVEIFPANVPESASTDMVGVWACDVTSVRAAIIANISAKLAGFTCALSCLKIRKLFTSVSIPTFRLSGEYKTLSAMIACVQG